MADTSTESTNTQTKLNSTATTSKVTETQSAVSDQQRIADINNMYDAQKNNTISGLKTTYDQNLSDAEAARDKIPDQYQNSYNDLSSEYERQRRNNNLAAQANGLNTGASSQMNLAQTNAYLNSKSNLQASENEALNDANKNITDLKTNYQNQIAEAASNSDYQRTAALLDEYSEQYNRTLTEAQSLAESGNFDGYAKLYGTEKAQQMQDAWAAQDPDLAYKAGVISGDEYFNMTGSYPSGYTPTGAALGSGSGSYIGWNGSMLESGVARTGSNGYGGVVMNNKTVTATSLPQGTGVTYNGNAYVV